MNYIFIITFIIIIIIIITLRLPPPPPPPQKKIAYVLFLSFSWEIQSPQEKLKTAYATFWRTSKVHYGQFENSELDSIKG